MKKKTERKALQINRETLVRLGIQDLGKVAGGALGEQCTGCPSGCGIFVEA